MNKVLTTLFLLGCSFFMANYTASATLTSEEKQSTYAFKCTLLINADLHDYSKDKYSLPTEKSCKDLVIGYYTKSDGNFIISGAANSIVHYDGEQFSGETDYNKKVLITVQLEEPKKEVQLTSIREDYKQRYGNTASSTIADEDFISIRELDEKSIINEKELNSEQTKGSGIIESNNSDDKHIKSEESDMNNESKNNIIFISLGSILILLIILFTLKKYIINARKEKKYW